MIEAEKERAAVVAWLRALPDRASEREKRTPGVREMIAATAILADAIERGEHLKDHLGSQ